MNEASALSIAKPARSATQSLLTDFHLGENRTDWRRVLFGSA